MNGQEFMQVPLIVYSMNSGWLSRLGERKHMRRKGLGLSLLAAAIVAIAVIGIASPGLAYLPPGRTTIVSTSSTGEPAADPGCCRESVVSTSGRFVAYRSLAPNIVPDANPGWDTFLHDRKRGKTEIVSINSSGLQAISNPLDGSGLDGSSHEGDRPAISYNGRYVAFTSTAALEPSDTNMCPAGPCPDIYVHDRASGATERISVTSSGAQAEGMSFDPSMSDDGRFVVFTSTANNLVEGESSQNRVSDVYLHDRKTHTTTRIAIATNGAAGNADSYCGIIDPTGTFVAFSSAASNFPDGSERTLGNTQIFLHDLKSAKTEMVSLGIDGSESDNGSFCLEHGLDISAGGRFVAFHSSSGNLVPNDSHAVNKINMVSHDVFVVDRQSARTRRVSVTSLGEETIEGESGGDIGAGQYGLDMSDDGRYVAFTSTAKNLFPDDNEIPFLPEPWEGDSDIFVHDLKTGATELVSIDLRGKDGACQRPSELGEQLQGAEFGEAAWPAISGDGRSIAFSSCDQNLTDNEASNSQLPLTGESVTSQIYVRDLGLPLGTYVTGASARGSKRQCILGSHCRQGLIVLKDQHHDQPVAVTQLGADLYGASIAYRPHYEDLLAAIELEEMPAVLPGVVSPILYGLRFSVEGTSYEVRATSLLGGTFALFDCTGSAVCTKMADLSGGYGTTGERVVLSLPLEGIGLEGGGELSDVEAFSAVGDYLTGSATTLDTMVLR